MAHDIREIDTLDVRSEEVQEILGMIPHWIVRWGIALFFVIIFIFIAGSFFIKYPEIINAPVVLLQKIRRFQL